MLMKMKMCGNPGDLVFFSIVGGALISGSRGSAPGFNVIQIVFFQVYSVTASDLLMMRRVECVSGGRPDYEPVFLGRPPDSLSEAMKHISHTQH